MSFLRAKKKYLNYPVITTNTLTILGKNKGLILYNINKIQNKKSYYIYIHIIRVIKI